MIPSGPGCVAVEVTGTGPLLAYVPGMGELRSSFRHLVPGLVAAAHRVATMDLGGHGDSDVAFDAYCAAATALLRVALLRPRGAPQTVATRVPVSADRMIACASSRARRPARACTGGSSPARSAASIASTCRSKVRWKVRASSSK